MGNSPGEYQYRKALQLARKDRSVHARQCVELWQDVVSLGHHRAEYALATWYLFGVGVRKNFKKAAVLLQKAASGGIPEAQYDLAVSYEKGKGLAKDYHKAFKWYLRAATRDRSARCQVGRCFYFGIGTKRNVGKAINWCRKAAKQGDSEAQYTLGRTYDVGDGLRRNGRLARLWYQKAVVQGHAYAKLALKDLCGKEGTGSR